MSSSEDIPRASGSGSGSRSASGSQTQVIMNGGKKRARYSNLAELFEGSTPEEVERQTKEYRTLLNAAEGILARACRIAES
jgi:hypothetical protein